MATERHANVHCNTVLVFQVCIMSVDFVKSNILFTKFLIVNYFQ